MKPRMGNTHGATKWVSFLGWFFLLIVAITVVVASGIANQLVQDGMYLDAMRVTGATLPDRWGSLLLTATLAMICGFISILLFTLRGEMEDRGKEIAVSSSE